MSESNQLKTISEMVYEGDVAINWKKFKQRFHIYNNATEGCKKSEKTQISLLLHLMGEEAIELFNTFEFDTEEENLQLSEVFEKFDSLFLPKKNDLYEHFKFFHAKQKPNQSIDSYLKDLKVMISSCNFKDKDILLRDKFIFGLEDPGLIEKFLRDPDITLDRAVISARASEIASKELKFISNRDNNQTSSSHSRIEIDHIKSDSKRKDLQCSKCSSVHDKNKCPAEEEVCFKCKRKGHFARNCRKFSNKAGFSNKFRVHECEITENTKSNTPYYIDTIASVPINAVESYRKEKAWFCDVQIENKPIKFKLDSGSEANILPLKVYRELKINLPLLPANIKLVLYGELSNITPIGQVELWCSYNDIKIKAMFIIIDMRAVPLLGAELCEDLQLIKRTYSVHSTSSKEEIINEYLDLFTGLGQIPGKYHIELKSDAVPVICPARRVPFSIQQKLKDTINQMEKNEIIRKIEEPTDWVSNLVIKEKKSGELRLCIDPKALNSAIKREHYALPTCEEILQRLSGRSVYSVIDMKQGFWQLKLDEESSKLCTFSTMFGRYCFLKAPFGLNAVPEVFGRKITQIFSNIEGVEVYFDDIIVAGHDYVEHDNIIRKVFEKAREFNIKFNRDKFQYRQLSVKFLGKEISKNGVRPDKEQVAAIIEMESPRNKKELQRFLGMTKYLSQFIPNLSDISAPLRELTKDRVEWTWSEYHEQSFNKLKYIISNRPVLRYYDSNKQLVVETDASKDGLGSCLLIENQPVSFASRALTSTEKMYAQIEKELLAIVFAMEKFHQFVYGHKIVVYSDHKPLTTIMKKNINEVSSRLQKLLLRLFRYDIDVLYKPGSQMFISDTLSRAFLNQSDDTKIDEYMVHEAMVFDLTSQLCISEERKKELIHEISNDTELQLLKTILIEGWPTYKKELPIQIRNYWQHKNDLVVEDDLLFFNNRVIIPQSLRSKYLKEIHEGHLGIVKCKSRARESLFWPSLNTDIQNMIESCHTCVQFSRNNQKEPLLPLPQPSRPWERISTDIFTFDNIDYLVIVDAYSLWIEMFNLTKKTALELITKFKSTFGRYGVPEILYSDNVPFNSQAFIQFAKDWNFNLVFSSPIYSQSNGLAEKAVGICKNLLKKSKDTNTDINISLLNYRNSTLASMSFTPSELFLNRKLKTKLPVNKDTLKPKLNKDVEQIWEKKINDQEKYYDQHAKPLRELSEGENVFMKLNDVWQPGVIIAKDDNPRSYIIEHNKKYYRRNRIHIKPFKGKLHQERRYDDDDDIEIVQNNLNVRPGDKSASDISPEYSSSFHDTGCHPLTSDVSPNTEYFTSEQPALIDNYTSETTRRSCRNRRKPIRLQDYIC